MITSFKPVFYAATVTLLSISPLYGDATNSPEAVRKILRNVERNYSFIQSARGEIQYMRTDSPETRMRLE